MSQRSIPSNRGQLETLGNHINYGLVLYEGPLGFTRVTSAEFEPILVTFGDENEEVNVSRTARQVASDKLQAADQALTDGLLNGRSVLTGSFGRSWSNKWAQAGWIPSTTAVPKDLGKKLGLALSLSKFLEKNSDYEVAKVGFTAKAIRALRDAVLKAQDETATATKDLKAKTDLLDGLQETVSDMIRDVIGILKVTLKKDDPRWLEFGLNIPATKNTPGVAQNLTLNLDGAGNIVAQNDPTPLATRYRYRGMVLGRDGKYRLMASSTEPVAIIKGVLAGDTVQMIVQAVNEGSQGVASEPVKFTMPMAEKAVAPETVAKETAQSNGTNGHGGRNRMATI